MTKLPKVLFQMADEEHQTIINELLTQLEKCKVITGSVIKTSDYWKIPTSLQDVRKKKLGILPQCSSSLTNSELPKTMLNNDYKTPSIKVTGKMLQVICICALKLALTCVKVSQ